MLTLYQVEWCPYCHQVRQVMTELGLTYLTVNVERERDDRAVLVALSGQSSVPVLHDGEILLTDSDEIVAYLRASYPPAPDAEQHAASGRWRTAIDVPLEPRAALARLKKLLTAKGFVVVSQVRGDRIGSRLPEGYVLLSATVPAAAAKAVEVDPLTPAAIVVPIAVIPSGDGSVVAAADPVGQVWLHGERPLMKVQSAVKQRLGEALAGLRQSGEPAAAQQPPQTSMYA